MDRDREGQGQGRCYLGESTVTWYCDLSRSLATLKPPQPDPTITTLGREEEEKEEVEMEVKEEVEERLLFRIRRKAGGRAVTSILTRSGTLVCL